MATYYMRADGTAANKAAASGPCGTQANCMSIATHNGETFSAGDTIVLCDTGGIYRDEMDVPSSGSAGSPITYQNASGDTPVISGAVDISAAGWADQGGDVWRHAIGAVEPEQVFFDGSTKGTIDATPDAKFEWTYTNPNLDVYATADPDDGVYYTQVEATQRDYGISLNDQDYIVIDGLTCTITNSMGIKAPSAVSPSTNIEIKNCTISYIAGIGIIAVADSTDWLIHNNTINYIGWELSKDAIYLFDGCDDWDIYNNTITNHYGDGVNIGQEGDQGDVSVYNNTIGPTTSTVAFAVAVESNSTTGTISIYGNTILRHDYGAIQIKGSNVKIYRNLIDITSNATDVTIQTNHGNADTGLEIYYNLILSGDDDANCAIYFNSGGSDAKIYNNVITGHYWGVHIEDETGVLIKNNIIFDNANYGIEASAGYSATITNNDVYNNTAGDYDATIGSQTGSNGNISADPLFIDASGGNFKLQKGSLCIDGGTGVSLTTDYEGNGVPGGRVPDIGAYERSSVHRRVTRRSRRTK